MVEKSHAFPGPTFTMAASAPALRTAANIVAAARAKAPLCVVIAITWIVKDYLPAWNRRSATSPAAIPKKAIPNAPSAGTVLGTGAALTCVVSCAVLSVSSSSECEDGGNAEKE
jgi:hypothetical protein